MIETISFKTRARTVDHLGREQIADCPTAISELWKNSYDAYARYAALHIFDSTPAVAALVDDGHGMNQLEFIDKWLVLGTESKATKDKIPEEDRDGLALRHRQGQKGIGRLSSAFLGPLLLVLSKRRNDDFVAALIDWRLFENPFLMLQDIQVPVVSFKDKTDIFEHLPNMFDQLMGNLWGTGTDVVRDTRIVAAWNNFDEHERQDDECKITTKEAIENTIIKSAFTEQHFSTWPVWNGEKYCGTGMFISDIQNELKVQILPHHEVEQNSMISTAQEDFIRTLSAFTNPYLPEDKVIDFSYLVMGWNGELGKTILSNKREINYSSIQELEHVVDGSIDELGIFRGKIKAFGKWQTEELVIRPPNKIPSHPKTKIGPFSLRIATYERSPGNTTLTKDQYAKFDELCQKYAGFMIHRDGLRVMPYGRTDNDYFGLDERRGKNAGTAFWATRNMFGGISISRDENPNLRDKAGREGLIQNSTLKSLREIVVNIFMSTADMYFGRQSELRKVELPKIQGYWNEQKAAEEDKRKRKLDVKRFRSNLKNLEPKLNEFNARVESIAEKIKSGAQITSEDSVKELREEANKFGEEQKTLKLVGKPRNLSEPYEDRYHEYNRKYYYTRGVIQQLLDTAQEGLKSLNPKSAEDIVKTAISTNKGLLTKRMNGWVKEASSMLGNEVERLKTQVKNRTEEYEIALNPILDRLDAGVISASDALPEIDKVKENFDSDNETFFTPYLSALTSLQESIDLEGLATFGMEEVSELRSELERLNSLAQLGITVEILGHELDGLDNTITHELDALPKDWKEHSSIRNIQRAHQQLTDHLRFLSPLKLSGQAEKKWISGVDIVEYINSFFGDVLRHSGVTLEVTNTFKSFRIYDLPGKIYPVFINLVNNSRYWVCRDDSNQRLIKLDASNNKIIIGDDGPGVATKDIGHLFTLFFTRKTHGGRGVGLYLCRANLSAGGHKIEYVNDSKEKILSGANFTIEFQGAEYD
jgi:signal transduction histidine kinase